MFGVHGSHHIILLSLKCHSNRFLFNRSSVIASCSCPVSSLEPLWNFLEWFCLSCVSFCTVLYVVLMVTKLLSLQELYHAGGFYSRTVPSFIITIMPPYGKAINTIFFCTFSYASEHSHQFYCFTFEIITQALFCSAVLF